MRPRLTRPDRPYYGSRQQRFRLFLLVGAFSLVVIGAQLVRDARLWTVFEPRNEAKTDPTAGKSVNFGVDFEDESPLAPDEFRSKPASPRPKRHVVATAEIPGEEFDEPASDASISSIDDPENTRIDREWLLPIRDNTLGIRRDEAESFYAVLAKARDVPLSFLEADSTGPAAFRVLMIDSDAFRGRLVTLEGEVRKLTEFSADQNEFGISKLYEAWIRADDSLANPYRVVFTTPPEGIPFGDAGADPPRVKVTGYFFKRESYASVGGLHTAPLILAKRLKRTRLSPLSGPEPPPPYLGMWVLGALVLAATSFGVMIWRFSVGDRKFHQRHTRRVVHPEGDPGPEVLRDLVLIDTGEMLRQLAEAERRELEQDAVADDEGDAPYDGDERDAAPE